MCWQSKRNGPVGVAQRQGKAWDRFNPSAGRSWSKRKAKANCRVVRSRVGLGLGLGLGLDLDLICENFAVDQDPITIMDIEFRRFHTLSDLKFGQA
jgi:hypothetical protein